MSFPSHGMVGWDGRHSRDGGMECGTGWDFPSVSFPSYGTVGGMDNRDTGMESGTGHCRFVVQQKSAHVLSFTSDLK